MTKKEKVQEQEPTVNLTDRINPHIGRVTLPVGVNPSQQAWEIRVQSARENDTERKQLEADSGATPTNLVDQSVARGIVAETVFEQRRAEWKVKRWHVGAGLGVAALLVTGVYLLSQPAEAEQLPTAPVSSQEDPGFLGDISGITKFADALGDQANKATQDK